MLRSEPIRRRRLYEEISSRIEAAIISQDLQPGDILPSERELMETFGVGRTAVREALFALQKSGLVKLTNGQKAVVAKPTADSLINELSGPARHVIAEPERLRQLQQARGLLEGFLARIAAQRATPQQIAELEKALVANREAIDDYEKFVETNIAFHYGITSITENIFIEGLHRAIYVWLKDQRTVSARAPGACESAYGWHEKIFEAIRDHDPDRAEQAMMQHISQAQDAYWRVIEAEAEVSAR
ncbi:FCD domain-containing protein [Rhizobium puerariae]|uniref:FCD domain-containing protein n=1 Tax=Rhizobium puerariae TaxID=1585791 RepID=A0ABV6AMV7_9HYPH